MLKRGLFKKILPVAVGAVVALATVQYAQANTNTVLFEDDFNRSNSNSLGNGWVETEPKSLSAKVESNRLTFTPTDGSHEPIVEHSFPHQSHGVIEFTHDYDWKITGSENTYAVHVQLGSSGQMEGADSTAGIAVDLKWAGPAYGMDTHEGYGYTTGSDSVQVAELSGPATIKTTVDLDANTFDLDINPGDGVVEAASVPLINNNGIDTLRIFADSVNYRKFSGRAFDNILIKHTSEGPQDPAPAGPTIVDVNASDILDTSTSINWHTDQPATGQVSYGLTDCACDDQTELKTELTTDHLHYIGSLQPDTTYYYTVTSSNADGTTSTSSVHTFQTVAPPDTTAPIIEVLDVTNIGSSRATVSVVTDKDVTVTVSYDTIGCACGLQATSSSLNTAHEIALTGLQADTTYYYQVTAQDGSSNTTDSVVQSFKTEPRPVSGDLFSDSFDRSDSSIVGNGWVEQENKSNQAIIKNNRLELHSTDDSFAPVVSRSFNRQANGTLEWTLDTNWKITGSENNYEMLMQLGDSASMSPPAQDSLAGTAVSLKWGSPSYGLDTPEGLGYTNQNGTTQITTLSGGATIYVQVNLDTKTYSVDINPGDGVVEAANIPFTGIDGIDTIRFYTNALNSSKISGKWFDNILIRGADDEAPGPIDTTPPVISNMSISSVGSRSATVKLNTNEPATAQVMYSTSPCPCTSGTPISGTPKTSHSIQLNSLKPNTIYYYQVVATDLAGNTATSQPASFKTTNASNMLTVQDNWVLRDGQPIKLMGVRTASATHTQYQTDHLIDQLDEYKAHGVNTVTVFYMGSRSANYDPFSRDGTTVDAGHQARMEQIIQAADARDMVVIVGIFYQAAPIKLNDGPAFYSAVRTVASSLSQYDNIIINIANEHNSGGYSKYASKADINDPQVIIDMAAAVHDVDPDRIVGGGGYDSSKNIQIGLASEIDILLFDTGGGNRNSGTLYDSYLAAGVTKPMANVEVFGGYSNRFGDGIRGVFKDDEKKLYTDELDRAQARAPLGLFFHSGPWLQVDPMRYNLGGYGTVADPGIRWYFEYVRDNITHP